MRGQRVVPVADHHVGGAHENPSHLARSRVRAAVGHHPHRDAHHRLPDRPRLRRAVRRADAIKARFRHAADFEQRLAHDIRHQRMDGSRARVTTHHPVSQSAEIGRPRRGVLEKVACQGGRREQIRRPRYRVGLPKRPRVMPLQERDASADTEHRHQLAEHDHRPADAHARQRGIVGRKRQFVDEQPHAASHAILGVGHTLGPRRGP